jgi:protein-S-isoprenylcysteine O-methyltransferase Ste14
LGLYTGCAFLWGSWWTLLWLPVLILLMTRFVIQREERYLKRAFGNSYTAYKQQVRRWI